MILIYFILLLGTMKIFTSLFGFLFSHTWRIRDHSITSSGLLKNAAACLYMRNVLISSSISAEREEIMANVFHSTVDKLS